MKIRGDYLNKNHADEEMIYLDEELTVKELKEKIRVFSSGIEKSLQGGASICAWLWSVSSIKDILLEAGCSDSALLKRSGNDGSVARAT